MNITEIQRLYASAAQAGALLPLLNEPSVRTVSLEGLLASAAALFFSGLSDRLSCPVLFVLPDADEAGYFYHDLTQVLGEAQVLFFPSTYRRAVKYGQRDAGNEILRTEVLSRLSSYGKRNVKSTLFVVTEPSALAELVVSKKQLDARTLQLSVGETIDVVEIEKTLREFGFKETDYVYEPGQFAVRGSILDVYSYSCDMPYRIDFFGDDIDTIRTFEIESQLSKTSVSA